MNKLPEGWQKIALGEVLESAVDGPFGSNLKTEHYVKSPGVRVVRLQNIGTGYFNDRDHAYISTSHARALNKHEVRSGDLLVASLGDENHPVARACSYPEEWAPAIVKADCFRLRPKKGLVSVKYIALALNSPSSRQGIEGYFQGVTRDRINLSALLRFRIPVPSLKKQWRITEILGALNGQLSAAQAVIERSRLIRLSVLDGLIREGGTKQFGLGELAEATPGGSVIGPFGSDLTANDYRSAGSPVVFVRDIKIDGFRWVSNVYVSEQKARTLHAHSVEGGDFLMTKMGLPPCIAAVYPEGFPSGIITADVVRIRLNKSLVDARWLSHVVNSEIFAAQVRGITGGVTRPKVTLRDVRSLTVSLPDLYEQQRRADIVQKLTKQIDAAVDEQQRVALVKRGLMEDLLSGRVRV